MAAFAAGETGILVSTTVVEVGVDVPNATLMVVENAERFGLSQLHQLRGRVGRGKAKSYCVLVSDTPTEESRERLRVLTRTNNGFEIAQADLELRGPGDFFGSRQHGLPEMHVKDLLGSMDMLHEAQSAAEALCRKNPALAARSLPRSETALPSFSPPTKEHGIKPRIINKQKEESPCTADSAENRSPTRRNSVPNAAPILPPLPPPRRRKALRPSLPRRAAPVEPAMPPQGTPDPAAAFGVIAAPRRGMKWFKFIIYFQLWAGMLVNLVTAGKYFTGAYYEGNAEMVYRVFPALQPLDIVMGVVCLALAVYAVVVQRALAKFRAKGPMMYYLMYIVNTAATVLYLLIGSIIIGQSVFTAEVAGSIIGSLVMLFVNIPYFNNRKHLFVNP